MITLTESLKKRFCKDQNLPIKVYSEPIFTERLKLFDAYEKYLEFCSMYRIRFGSDEQAYFAYYNDLKDRIINYIKESEAFQSLNKADMYKEFPIYGEGIPKGDAYKDKNIGKSFLSIDMKKANIYSMCSDEIILHMDDLRLQDIEYIQKRIAESPLDLRMEQYSIGKIAGTDVFVKIFTDGEMEIKCASAEEAVFAQKLIKGIPFDNHDFYISTKYGTAVLTEFDTTALKLVITQEELENEDYEIPDL